jgi:hypothetical protein
MRILDGGTRMNKLERAEFLQKVQAHGRTDIWRKISIGRRDMIYVTSYQTFAEWRQKQDELVGELEALSPEEREDVVLVAAEKVLIATERAINRAGEAPGRVSIAAHLRGLVTMMVEELEQFEEVAACLK